MLVLETLEEITKILEEKSQATDLKINEGGTKLLKMAASVYRRRPQNTPFGQYKFENVKRSSYLESSLKNQNVVPLK